MQNARWFLHDVVTVSMALTAVSLPEISRWVKQPTWKYFWVSLKHQRWFCENSLLKHHQTWWEFQKRQRRSTKEIRDHNQRRSKKLHVFLFNHRLLMQRGYRHQLLWPFCCKVIRTFIFWMSKIRDPHGTLIRNVGILVIETTSPSSPSNGTESQRTPKS